MKGCICHFAKWQIHSFISKGTIFVNFTFFVSDRYGWWSEVCAKVPQSQSLICPSICTSHFGTTVTCLLASKRKDTLNPSGRLVISLVSCRSAFLNKPFFIGNAGVF